MSKKICLFICIIIHAGIMPAVGMEDDDEFTYEYRYKRGSCTEVYDPYEKFNRKMFAFNNTLDKVILRPVANLYRNIINNYTRSRINSVLENIEMPITIVNYALQGNYNATMINFWRLIINTTFGIGGLFDVAGKIGVKTTAQTFGNTLAYYGATPGPYLVLPVLGNMSGRDAFDTMFKEKMLLFLPIHRDIRLGLTGLKTISTRSELIAFTDALEKNAMDYYITVRNVVYWGREAKMNYSSGKRCQ